MNELDNSTKVQPNNISLQSFAVSIPTADGKKVAYKVPAMLPMEWDESIQDWLLTPDAMQEIENIKARHMGLLTAQEIRELRASLNLTQKQIAEVLKIGDKTWTRWESGRQRPSQSLNLLLRALQRGILTPYALHQLGMPSVDWTGAVQAKANEPQPATLMLPYVEVSFAATYEEMPLAS